MDTQVKKVTANDTIYSIVRAINQNNIPNVYQALGLYVDTLARGGDIRNKLSRLLKERPLSFTRLNELSSNVKNLLICGDLPDELVFLDNETEDLIKGLLVEHENKEKFIYHNIKIRKRILLYGPTGNGKTTIAKHIARFLKLPFVEIKSEMVIDSRLGTTSANIFKLIDAVQEPCVLFWDEIDSIGHKRGGAISNSAQLENDRMTNSILLGLDRLMPDVVFVGATNRFDILDSAFLRRFDVKYEVKEPTEEEKMRFSEMLLSHFKLPGIVIEVDKFTSYAQIKEHVNMVVRDYILSEIKNSI